MPPLLLSPEQRSDWWASLSSNWKDAFVKGYLRKVSGTMVTDQGLQAIATTPVLRLVGPRGLHSNITEPLETLAPLAPLINLEYLFVTFCELRSSAGIESLTRLKSLFIHNNHVVSLDPIAQLSNLEELYCNDNRITTLFPIQHCHQLHTIQCQHNALTNLRGLTKIHAQQLRRFTCLPNDGIRMAEIMRVERKLGIKCSKE